MITLLLMLQTEGSGKNLLSTYNILYCRCHWWPFLTMFMTVPVHSSIFMIVYYCQVIISFQLLKWPSPPWNWQTGQPPLWVSPGQPAIPSATPSLCPTPPKMAPSLSPNLPTVTPPTLWPPSNLAPLTGLRWRLWGRETEQMDRGQRSWGTSLLRM